MPSWLFSTVGQAARDSAGSAISHSTGWRRPTRESTGDSSADHAGNAIPADIDRIFRRSWSTTPLSHSNTVTSIHYCRCCCPFQNHLIKIAIIPNTIIGVPNPFARRQADCAMERVCAKVAPTTQPPEERPMPRTFVIAQGGGPTAVINQTMAGAALEVRRRHPERQGARRAARRARHPRRRLCGPLRRARGAAEADRRHAERRRSARPATSPTRPIASSCSRA